MRLQYLIQHRFHQFRQPILAAQQPRQQLLAYANINPSHRFSPSVVDRLATSIYRFEAVATCHPIYSSLRTQSLRARSGYRLGHGEVKDHLFLDGLEDAYDKGRLMGTFAEDCAARYGFTREAQDRFAIVSLTRAQTATRDGTFARETVAVQVKSPRGERMVTQDELPLKADPEKIPNLKPAFKRDGTVTPANSSAISDGAAALVLMRMGEAEKRGLKPIAVIKGHATHSQEPAWFTTAPVGAIQKLYAKVGWSDREVDLYEINEAFAVVTMAAMQTLKLSHDKVNVHGGACALGHPIGASGARIMVTLLNALEKHGLKRGIAALCIGGGEATAVAVERI
ncbi:MAG: hypothetical protein DI596_08340 [Azospira oryzae]|nr:MAG: hypothetical protein DI596_08340 [Azospira oryzae]PZP79510.1 MAG: hypothetical protein DI593_08340 [Azospira oryzae]